MFDMSRELSFSISGDGPASRAARVSGFPTFDALAEHIRALPYGRPRELKSLVSVLKEGCGTCSSKHRLLAAVAHDCGHLEVQLVVGVYGMSEENTPGVGPILEAASLHSIPEAHCYLVIGRDRFDFTGLGDGASSPFDSLLIEQVISPEKLLAEKPKLHRQAMQEWASGHGLNFSRTWAIREACIAVLTANN